MSTIDIKENVGPMEFQRMELRSLVKLAGEPISHFWPMQTFIHHNPLHGLEGLPFDQAVEQGRKFFGGMGYLSNREYQNYFQQGRITEDSVNEAVKAVSQNMIVTIGDRKISHLEALRTILIYGTGKVPDDLSSAILQESLNEPDVKGIVEKLQADLIQYACRFLRCPHFNGQLADRITRHATLTVFHARKNSLTLGNPPCEFNSTGDQCSAFVPGHRG